MTEITANNNFLYPSKTAERRLVDPVAFALAMVGAPLLVGLLGMHLLAIPTFAAIGGGPIYLVIGGPVMLIWIAKNRATPARWALLALKTHLCVFVPICAYGFLSDRYDPTWPLMFLAFGTIFAPLWGGVSGRIYQSCERDFYKQTL